MAGDRATERWTRDVEQGLLQRFRQKALQYRIADLPQAWDILGWWEVMQHHGAPTRLLDWTTSPFIAIWFALDGHQDGDGDMALWVYDRSSADPIMKAAVANNMATAEDNEELDDRQLQNRIVKFAIESGRRTLIPVRPRQFSRAVAQQSALTVSLDIGVGRPGSWWSRELMTAHIRLKEEWKSEMRAACRSLGISRPDLFRDLDSLGKSVAEGFQAEIYSVDPYY